MLFFNAKNGIKVLVRWWGRWDLNPNLHGDIANTNPPFSLYYTLSDCHSSTKAKPVQFFPCLYRVLTTGRLQGQTQLTYLC